jgi:hypothetical protein
MSQYLKISDAALYLGVTTQAVYKQVRRGVIRYKMIDGVTFTTIPWLDTYFENRHSKEHHARWKGRPVFDMKKGELSVKMCSEITGLSLSKLFYDVSSGRIPFIRRGAYCVIMRSDLDEYLHFLESSNGFKNILSARELAE